MLDALENAYFVLQEISLCLNEEKKKGVNAIRIEDYEKLMDFTLDVLGRYRESIKSNDDFLDKIGKILNIQNK